MNDLPIRRSLTPAYILSLFVALLMSFTALGSILYQTTIYPSANLRYVFVATDAGNLLIALPLLLVSLWLTYRGNIMGLLCWPGALFYVLYVYVPYLIAIPFNLFFPAYLLLIPLSGIGIFYIMANIDGVAIRRRFIDQAPARTAAGILVGLSVLIILRQSILMVTALMNQTTVDIQELALWIDDFALAVPLMLISGILLWRREPLGFVTAPALLVAYGFLSIGLVPVMIVQAYSLDTTIDTVGIAVVLVMAAICLVPFALFFRRNRTNKKEKKS
ncbi:MAG: hypothetical protein H8E14_12340 [Candidatus Marinimicrobia bacterium]|nr:hypothetical protein [Candidatus Neomarinimicrobiota bacterium]